MIFDRRQILIFLVLVTSYVKSDVLNRFDPVDINEPCDSGVGTYKLEADCASKGLNRRGFLIGYGAVVCCPKVKVTTNIQLQTTVKPVKPTRTRTRGDAARDFCNKNGWKINIFEEHIIAGKDAKVDQFPLMVALFALDANNASSFLCGGSLISEKFILTAAHCFKQRSRNFFVRMGRTSIDLADTNDTSVAVDMIIDLKKVRRHEGYKQELKYNDIALIELNRPVTFADNVKPICLEVENLPAENRNLTICGFGSIDNDKDKSLRSDWLKFADVEEFDYQMCKAKFNEVKDLFQYVMPEGVVNSQMCAMGRADIKGNLPDTCQGDSGGPLIYESKSERKYYLTGITSFGLACGSQYYPSIYTRVSNYIEWIEERVWPQ